MEWVFVAVGPDGQRREWALQDREYQVGRADGQQRENWLAIEGIPHLSRRILPFAPRPVGSKCGAARGARNPLFCGGQEREAFEISPGQLFNTGKTQFGLRTQQPAGEATLFGLSKEKARLRRLEDCFAAVTQVLERLRSDPSGTSPWLPAFSVIQSLLPSGGQSLIFVDIEGGNQRILDRQSFSQATVDVPDELLHLALERNSTVTRLNTPSLEPGGGTISAVVNWVVVAPIRGLESSAYALAAFGSDYLDQEALEEVAAIIDVVADLVGHHLIVQQAAEYSNLLGVFGHHVGTLFKTSGALKLWADPQQAPEVRHALNNLLPIWGFPRLSRCTKSKASMTARHFPPTGSCPLGRAPPRTVWKVWSVTCITPGPSPPSALEPGRRSHC